LAICDRPIAPPVGQLGSKWARPAERALNAICPYFTWSIAPVFRVRDVRASAAFYRERFGFDCPEERITGGVGDEGAVYAIARRDGIEIHLGRQRTGWTLDAGKPPNALGAYFFVADVDALHASSASAVRPSTPPASRPMACARSTWSTQTGSTTPSADAWALAMALFAPCYLSGWTAAEHWDLTEQIFNATCVVTSRPQRHRERIVAGTRFVFRLADKNTFFGTTPVWNGSHRVDIADPHRLVIDILAAPDFGGGARHTLDVVRNYLRSKHADPEKLIAYAQRFGKGVVFKRLGFCVESFGAPSVDWLQRCKAGMSQGVSQLDPNGPKRGHVVSRWRLRINIPVDET